MSGNRVRVALVGIGAIGRKYAGFIKNGLIPGMELVGVCARSRESHDWVRENLGRETAVYGDIDEMFRRQTDFDTVIVASPHSSHLEYTTRSLAAGKHVMCDKPAGISIKEARLMGAAAHEAPTVYFMMFHRRSYPKYIALKELIDSGELGELRRVSAKDITSFRTQFYHKSCSWRSSWNGENGGMLLNQGQHSLDIWQWLFGMPESVYAYIPFGKYNGFRVDDEASLLMEYKNGMTGSFFMTTGEPAGQDVIEIVGTKGRAVLTGARLEVCIYHIDMREYAKHAQVTSSQEIRYTVRYSEYEEMDEEKPYIIMLNNFTQAILNHSDLIAPGEEGERAMELANAAYLSAWTGKKAVLPLDAGEYERYLEQAKKDEM